MESSKRLRDFVVAMTRLVARSAADEAIHIRLQQHGHAQFLGPSRRWRAPGLSRAQRSDRF